MLDEAVEARVRRIVAEALGVDEDEIVRDVSLTDDLAADSLDLVELVLAVESGLGIAVSSARAEELRTYADLLDTVSGALADARRMETQREMNSRMVRARIISAGDDVRGALEHAGELTPYAAETIVDDALRAGPGARLEVTTPATTEDAAIASIEARFRWLTGRDVQVTVRRDHRWRAESSPPA